jgi:hypothetical protein
VAGEQRRHPRAALELPVVVTDRANKVLGHILFDTLDLSAGGAFIRSDLLFEVGEELQVGITLPSGRVIQARGKVVRVVRDVHDEGVAAGMGIQFVQLSDADQHAIVAALSG